MKIKIEHNSHTYCWSGACWLDHYGLQVHDKLAANLNKKYLESWWATCGDGEAHQMAARLADLRRGAVDRDSRAGLGFVASMARQLLKKFPQERHIWAVLCAALRAQGQAQLALATGMPELTPGPSALRTTLAASLCDLGRWEEARQMLSGSGHSFARAVTGRIQRIEDGPFR